MRNSFLVAMYLVSQVVNITKYGKLAMTKNMEEFKISDCLLNLRTHYTRYYVNPNPLKILIKRLKNVNNAELKNNEIYKNIVEYLSVSDLEELISLLNEMKKNNSIAEKKKIESIENAILEANKISLQHLLHALSVDTLNDFVSRYLLLKKDQKK